MNIKYISLVLRTIPLLPILYLQGKKVRKKIPELPEAKGDSGIANGNSEDNIQLIILGESTIAGVGVITHEEGFSGSLARELTQLTGKTVKWKVYAKSGFRAKEVTIQLVPKIKEANLDFIAIGLGGNDAFQLNTPSGWKKDIQELIEVLRLKYPKTPIIFANMPPIHIFPAFTPLMQQTIGGLVEILGKELKQLIDSQENVYYHAKKITIDYWANKYHLDTDLSLYFSDGVHPSKLTYQIWAKDFAEFIDETVDNFSKSQKTQ